MNKLWRAIHGYRFREMESVSSIGNTRTFKVRERMRNERWKKNFSFLYDPVSAKRVNSIHNVGAGRCFADCRQYEDGRYLSVLLYLCVNNNLHVSSSNFDAPINIKTPLHQPKMTSPLFVLTCALNKKFRRKKNSKMKFVLVFAAIFAVAFAAPGAVVPSKDAVVVRYENDNIGVNGYNFE